MGQPKFFLGIVEIIEFDVVFGRGKKLCVFELVEKGTDFRCREEPPDLGDKSR